MENNLTEKKQGREAWIDWMRIAACLMVFIVHSTEPFYLGGDGALILTKTDAFWASFFDSFVRACVPLFIATPTLACARAGASFVPSPIIATSLPACCSFLIYSILSSGLASAMKSSTPAFSAIYLA